jgi:3-oxoacyl-[acyl-carrier protein] reductase
MTAHALITGSTRGIGYAVARGIVLAGGHAMLTGRSEAGVHEAVQTLTAEIGDASRVKGTSLDVRDPGSVAAAIAAAEAAFSRLDVVVNNAGVGVYRPVESCDDAAWRTVIETNLTGPFQVMRAAIPALRRAGGGSIVNVASLAGAHPFAGAGAYCASKAGLIALSDAAMQELRGDNIKVSVVLPGSVATGFSAGRGPDDSWKLAADDVAAVVLDLLRHPARSLPSRVEIRPSQPRKG